MSSEMGLKPVTDPGPEEAEPVIAVQQEPPCRPKNPVDREDEPPEGQGQDEDLYDGHHEDDEAALEGVEGGGSVAVLGKVDVAAGEVGAGVDLAGLQRLKPLADEVAGLVGRFAGREAVDALDGRVVDEGAFG